MRQADGDDTQLPVVPALILALQRRPLEEERRELEVESAQTQVLAALPAIPREAHRSSIRLYIRRRKAPVLRPETASASFSTAVRRRPAATRPSSTLPAPGSPFEEFGVAAALLLLVLLELARRQGVVVAVARRPVPAALGLVLSATLLVPPHLVHAGGGPTGPLVQWVFSDPIGSGVLTTNSNGTQALRRLFEPFGRLEHETDLSGTWPRPRFAGHDEEDAYYATLYDFGARFYDPAVGHFLQVDPLVPDPCHPADLNPYAYVRNDPLNMVDPTGEFVVSVSLGLFFAKVVAGEAIVFGLGAIIATTVATAATAVGIHYAVSPESYSSATADVPHTELAAQDRSAATRSSLPQDADAARIDHDIRGVPKGSEGAEILKVLDDLAKVGELIFIEKILMDQIHGQIERERERYDKIQRDWELERAYPGPKGPPGLLELFSELYVVQRTIGLLEERLGERRRRLRDMERIEDLLRLRKQRLKDRQSDRWKVD